MPRRKQFKGTAHNLSQWVLSRNFDAQGYWAVGKLYKFSEENGTNKVILDLKLNRSTPESRNGEFDGAIELLAQVLHQNMSSNKMPGYWLQEVMLTFIFNVPYQHKYHYWGSTLGQPLIYSVYIKTDIGSIYTSESGCNCWVHDPQKERRRYGF